MRIFLVLFVVLLTGCVSENQSGTFSSDFNQEQAARTRVSLGLTYLKNGNYSQAKQNLDKALEFAPRLPETHYGLAYYYQTVGEVLRADEAYQAAMKLAPRDADIANSYGAFLCQDGQYDKAMDFFNQAVSAKQYANSAQTYENMALCAQSVGKGEEAIAFLNSALNHQPGRAKTLFILTEMYVATEQFDLAADTLRRYERVARVSADSLWLAIEIAQGQGNLQAASGYGDMLVQMYPDSSLTRLYLQRQRETPQPVVKVKAKQTSEPVKAPAPKADTAETAAIEQNRQTTSGAETEENVEEGADTAAQASTDTAPDEQVDEAEAALENRDMPKFHIVQRGENLYRLSLQYNIKLDTLKEWNDLGENGSIRFGMKLWLVPPAEQTN